MLPMVSRRAPPTGHLFVSSFSLLRCTHSKKTLLPMSKMESIPVAMSESDNDDMAAYTAISPHSVPASPYLPVVHLHCRIHKLKFAIRLAQMAIFI